MTMKSVGDSPKPVAEVWYSVEACENNIIRFRESHIDSYSIGDIRLVRGSERDLAWPPDAPETYCSSLRRMGRLPVNWVYPGHYGMIDRKRMLEVIDEQLADLEQRP